MVPPIPQVSPPASMHTDGEHEHPEESRKELRATTGCILEGTSPSSVFFSGLDDINEENENPSVYKEKLRKAEETSLQLRRTIDRLQREIVSLRKNCFRYEKALEGIGGWVSEALIEKEPAESDLHTKDKTINGNVSDENNSGSIIIQHASSSSSSVRANTPSISIPMKEPSFTGILPSSSSASSMLSSSMPTTSPISTQTGNSSGSAARSGSFIRERKKDKGNKSPRKRGNEKEKEKEKEKENEPERRRKKWQREERKAKDKPRDTKEKEREREKEKEKEREKEKEKEKEREKERDISSRKKIPLVRRSSAPTVSEMMIAAEVKCEPEEPASNQLSSPKVSRIDAGPVTSSQPIPIMTHQEDKDPNEEWEDFPLHTVGERTTFSDEEDEAYRPKSPETETRGRHVTVSGGKRLLRSTSPSKSVKKISQSFKMFRPSTSSALTKRELALKVIDTVAVFAEKGFEHSLLPLIQLIDAWVASQPGHIRRVLSWYHGQGHTTKHGDGTFYPPLSFHQPSVNNANYYHHDEPLCGSWTFDSLTDSHHVHLSHYPPILSAHLALHHHPALSVAKPLGSTEIVSEFKSPPLSPLHSPRSKATQAATESVPVSQKKEIEKSLFDRTVPEELKVYVFSFLDIKSLCRAAQVCTEWRRLTNDPMLWMELHEKRWIRRMPHNRQIRERQQSASIVRADIGIDWKETVRGEYLLERNWHQGNCVSSTLRGHNGWVTCVDLHTNKLVSSSYDGTVRVWNTQTGNSLLTLPDNITADAILSPVWCVEFKENLIFGGSSDSKTRCWDMYSGQCIRLYEGHAGGVKCLQIDEDGQTFLTGSDDKTIKVFDTRTGVCVHSTPFNGAVSAMQRQGNDLLTVIKRENDVFWYDMRNSALVKTLSGHTKAVYCLRFDKESNLLATGSRDRSIFLWDLQLGECVRRLEGHGYSVMSLRFDHEKLVSGSADETVKIWDINTGRCMQTLRGHKEVIMSVKFDATKIVTGSADKTVVVWDFLRG